LGYHGTASTGIKAVFNIVNDSDFSNFLLCWGDGPNYTAHYQKMIATGVPGIGSAILDPVAANTINPVTAESAVGGAVNPNGDVYGAPFFAKVPDGTNSTGGVDYPAPTASGLPGNSGGYSDSDFYTGSPAVTGVTLEMNADGVTPLIKSQAALVRGFNTWDWKFKNCEFANSPGNGLEINNPGSGGVSVDGCTFSRLGGKGAVLRSRAQYNPLVVLAGTSDDSLTLGDPDSAVEGTTTHLATGDNVVALFDQNKFDLDVVNHELPKKISFTAGSNFPDNGGSAWTYGGASLNADVTFKGCTFKACGYQNGITAQFEARGLPAADLLLQNCSFFGNDDTELVHLPQAVGYAINLEEEELTVGSANLLQHQYANLTGPNSATTSYYKLTDEQRTLDVADKDNLLSSYPLVPDTNGTGVEFDPPLFGGTNPGLPPYAGLFGGFQQFRNAELNSNNILHTHTAAVTGGVADATVNPSFAAARRDLVRLGGIKNLSITNSSFAGGISTYGLRLDPFIQNAYLSSLTANVSSSAALVNTFSNTDIVSEGPLLSSPALEQLLKTGESPEEPITKQAIFNVTLPETATPEYFLMRATMPVPRGTTIASLEAAGYVLQDEFNFIHDTDANGDPIGPQFEPVAYYPDGNPSVVEINALLQNYSEAGVPSRLLTVSLGTR
jgi:hypothetical protein